MPSFRSVFLTFSALVLSSSIALADTTFDASGVTANGSTLSGTVVINTTTGTLVSIDFTMTGTFSFTATTVSGEPGAGPATGAYVVEASTNSNLPYVALDLPVTTLVGYTGGDFCLNPNTCNGGTVAGSLAETVADNRSYFTSGGLTAEAPEPASFLLLGIGAALLLARRRQSL